MRAGTSSSAIAFVIASASAFAGCGSDELFEPRLAANERLLAREAVATFGMDDQGLEQLAVIGDIDGDGIDDAAVRSYFLEGLDPQARHTGAVYVVYGGNLSGPIDVSTLPSLTGVGESGRIAQLGDVDGDGLADFLVGARTAGICRSPEETTCEDGGRGGVYLVYGSATRLRGATPTADTGLYLRYDTPFVDMSRPAGLGDLDGDGNPDFAISARLFPVTDGPVNVFVFYGKGVRQSGTLDLASTAAAVISTPTFQVPGIARAGDVDGDGYGDVLLRMSQGTTPEGVRLIHGGPKRLAGTIAVGDLGAPQFADGDRHLNVGLGAALGDLDGDGLDDFCLFSYKETGTLSYSTIQLLYYGRAGSFAPIGVDGADATFVMSGAGHTKLAGGDVDGDGRRDLLVSDAGLYDRNGAVHLLRGDGTRLSGIIDLAMRATTYVGMPLRGVICGYTMSSDCIEHAAVGSDIEIGDLTGDHRADILIGAATNQGVLPVLGVHGSSLAHAYLVSPSREKP